MEPPEPQAAATVVVVGDGTAGLEVLMLRRNSAHAFGGMWVFPGGRVDPGDAVADDRDPERAAARCAAVREAREEAGLVIEPGTLVPFSHWTPPPQAPRRFITWFFLAPAPAVSEVRIDGREIHEHAWITPGEAIRRRDAGEIELAPPTWVTLQRLTAFPDVAGAVAAAVDRQPQRFATRVASADGVLVTLWAGDAGYDDGDVDRPGPRHRLYMADDGWRYEADGAV